MFKNVFTFKINCISQAAAKNHGGGGGVYLFEYNLYAMLAGPI